MADPYVIFPGTAGNYLSTADVNLVDADTSHIWQSKGKWRAWFNTNDTIAFQVDAPDFQFGKAYQWESTNTSWTTVRADDVVGTPTVGETYTISLEVQSDRVGMNVEFEWVGVGAPTVAADTDSVPSTGTIRFSGSQVCPAGATSLNVYVAMKPTGGAVGDFGRLGAVCIREGTNAEFVPSLRVVGNLDLRADVALNVYAAGASQTLLSSAASLSNDSVSFLFGVSATGYLFMNHMDSGASWSTERISTEAIGTSDGVAAEFRTVFDPSDNSNLFYVDGVQLGAKVTNGGPVVRAQPGAPLDVGKLVNQDYAAGGFYYATMRDGIDGPVVAEFQATDIPVALTLPS